MNRKDLLTNLNNYLEKSANREHLTGSITKFLIWFFENSTWNYNEKNPFDEFADQIILSMNIFRSSNLDQVAEYRKEFLENSQLIKVASIPDLCELPNDKQDCKQRDAFAAILRLVICNAIYSAEFTYWPFIGFRIKTSQIQLTNAVSLFTAQVWENGFYLVATERSVQKVIKVGDIPISVTITDGQISLIFCEGRLQILFIENETYTIPRFSYHRIKLHEALSVIQRTIDNWHASQSDHSLVQVII